MIKIFRPSDKDFSSNGDVVIRPLKAKIHNEDNGDYYLELVTGLEWSDYVISNNIVVANTPQGDQAFRISNPEKTNSKITVKAWHVFYDSYNYLIEDEDIQSKTCSEALAVLTKDTPFEATSDIGISNSYRCTRESLNTAIGDVISLWGGHLVRDNFSFQLRYSIGVDSGITVQYKKNLKEITCEEDWDEVVTKLLPVGEDGLLLNALDPEADIYVYSDIQYDIPFTKSVTFDQDINEDDYTDADGNLNEQAYKQALINDLRQQAQAYVDENCVPQVNYTLKADLDRITDIGDIIRVKDERLGIDLITNVIAFDYDCILGQYTEVEFGNFKQTLSGLVSNITSSVDKTVEESLASATVGLMSDLEEATASIWATLGESYVMYDGDKILVLDSLPKESASKVIRINNEGVSYSSSGISGTYAQVWSIDGSLNMDNINVVNLVADMVKGGCLKLGGGLSGQIDVYDEANVLIGQISKDGLKMQALDGSYVLLDGAGFTGYDSTNSRVFWVTGDEFHMKKSVIEEEIILFNKVRLLPISTTDNDGIGFVAIGG